MNNNDFLSTIANQINVVRAANVKVASAKDNAANVAYIVNTANENVIRVTKEERDKLSCATEAANETIKTATRRANAAIACATIAANNAQVAAKASESAIANATKAVINEQKRLDELLSLLKTGFTTGAPTTLADEIPPQMDETMVEEIPPQVDETVVDEIAAPVDETMVDEIAAPVDETVVEEIPPQVDETMVDEIAAPVDETVVDEIAAPVDETVVEEIPPQVDETMVEEIPPQVDETMVEEIAAPVAETIVEENVPKAKLNKYEFIRTTKVSETTIKQFFEEYYPDYLTYTSYGSSYVLQLNTLFNEAVKSPTVTTFRFYRIYHKEIADFIINLDHANAMAYSYVSALKHVIKTAYAHLYKDVPALQLKKLQEKKKIATAAAKTSRETFEARTAEVQAHVAKKQCTEVIPTNAVKIVINGLTYYKFNDYEPNNLYIPGSKPHTYALCGFHIDGKVISNWNEDYEEEDDEEYVE